MVSAQPQFITAEDLWSMPDDGNRYELIRGELVRLPMSSMESSSIAMHIGSELRTFVRTSGLGLVMGADGAFILRRNPDTTRIPDVSFVSAERLPPVEERRRFPEMAPDLAVEVISPSDRTSETNRKVMDYLEAGVRLVWVVDPPVRTVAVHTPDRVVHILHEDDTLDGGDVLPGFTLPVANIFS